MIANYRKPGRYLSLTYVILNLNCSQWRYSVVLVSGVKYRATLPHVIRCLSQVHFLIPSSSFTHSPPCSGSPQFVSQLESVCHCLPPPSRFVLFYFHVLVKSSGICLCLKGYFTQDNILSLHQAHGKWQDFMFLRPNNITFHRPRLNLFISWWMLG